MFETYFSANQKLGLPGLFNFIVPETRILDWFKTCVLVAEKLEQSFCLKLHELCCLLTFHSF